MENLLRKAPWARRSIRTAQNHSTNLLKYSINRFKRLSACSWDEFDMSSDTYSKIETHKLKLKEDKFVLNLYPSEGQPCSCVCSWNVTLLKKVPGKTRKCKIEHYVIKSNPIRAFTGRITIFEDKIIIWGSIKDGFDKGDDFELTLTAPKKDTTTIQTPYLLEGSLLRGDRKKRELLEQTHDVVVIR